MGPSSRSMKKDFCLGDNVIPFDMHQDVSRIRIDYKLILSKSDKYPDKLICIYIDTQINWKKITSFLCENHSEKFEAYLKNIIKITAKRGIRFLFRNCNPGQT